MSGSERNAETPAIADWFGALMRKAQKQRGAKSQDAAKATSASSAPASSAPTSSTHGDKGATPPLNGSTSVGVVSAPKVVSTPQACDSAVTAQTTN